MDKLLIVDGNSVLYRAYYALPPLTNSQGLYTNAVYGFCNIFLKAVKDLNPTHIVVAFDYGKKTFRNEFFADYKKTRKPTPDELVMQFPIIKEVLQSMDICYIEMQGYEGDDIMGTLSKKFDVQSILLTGDRDSLQLIDDTTSVYLTKKGIEDVKIYNMDSLMEDKGISPSQVVDVKALMGDVSDNIPGVQGVGEIGAYKLIKAYDSLQGVYDHIDELGKGLQTKLIEGKQSAFLSYKLGTIKTDCEIDCKLEDFKLKFPFSSKFKEKCEKYDFRSILKMKNIFSLEDQEDPQIDIVKLKDVKQLVNALKQEIKDFVAIDIAQDRFAFCVSQCTIYEYDMVFDLFSIQRGMQDCVQAIKAILEDVNIKKYFFDLKNVKKLLYSYDINFVSCDDVALMNYLLMANDKTIDSQDFAKIYECKDLALAICKSIHPLVEGLTQENLLKLYKDIELPLVDTLLYMEQNGVKLDMAKLYELDMRYENEISQVEREIYGMLGAEINLNSPKQLGKALFEDLKIFVAGNKKQSTSVEILENIEKAHPVIPLILRYRKLMKLKSTYLDAYKTYSKEGVIHTHFLQMVTGTGRLSSKEPNLQNIPVRNDELKVIREIFISRFEKGKIVSYDYNQIELKLMAHFSGDQGMIDAFNSNQDIHSAVASKIYGIPLDEVSADQRRKAKTVNFGIIYGQGAYGLSKSLKISVKSAQEFMDSYFVTFPKVKKFMLSIIDKAKEDGYVATSLFGRKRYIPELKSSNFQLRSFGERVAMNMPLQGSASDIIKIAMNNIYKRFEKENLKSKMILQVHDELVFDVCEEELDIVRVIVTHEMQNVADLSIKLTVSEEIGDNLLK